MKKDDVEEFTIHVPAEVLSDLQQRLKNTRWSYQIEGTAWDAGTDGAYLKDLMDYSLHTRAWERPSSLSAHPHARLP